MLPSLAADGVAVDRFNDGFWNVSQIQGIGVAEKGQ
jgi:hypothetical protein